MQLGLVVVVAGWLLGAVQPAAEIRPRQFLGQLAEKSGEQFVLVPPAGMEEVAHLAPQEAARLRAVEDAAKALGLRADRRDAMVWVSGREEWQSGPLRNSCLETSAERATLRTLGAASRFVGRALIASLSQEQMEMLLNDRRPEDVLSVYRLVYTEVPPSWRPSPPFLTIGGAVTGDKLSDFQRRLCAAALYAGSVYYRWDRLTTAESASLADADVDCFTITAWRPEVAVTNRVTTPDRRWRGVARAEVTLDAILPVQPVTGAHFERLIEWAIASALADPPRQYLGDPPCEWRTNGPTRDFTSIITQEEARLSIPMPTDLSRSTKEVVEGFAGLGVRLELGDRLEGGGWGPEKEPPQGQPPQLTLLTVLAGALERSQYYIREGNTITLVYDWELSGEYCLDPAQHLPSDVCQKPVSMTSLSASIEEVLAAIREQTGAQVFPGAAAQESQVRLTLRVKDVPALDLLRGMTKYLEGGWEVRDDGSLVLVPRGYLQPDRYGVPPVLDREEGRPERSLGMAVALLVEALTEEERGRAAQDFLPATDLKSVAQNLLLATAALAFTNPSPVPESAYLSNLQALPDGGWQGTVWLGNASVQVASLEVPTIPPNKPTGRLVFVVQSPGPPHGPD